jgi:hypothetical protein
MKVFLYPLLLFICLTTKSQRMTPESASSLFVEIFHGATRMATASGFIIQKNGHRYLVSNQHVLRNWDVTTSTWANPSHPFAPDRVLLHYIDPTTALEVVRTELLFDGGVSRVVNMSLNEGGMLRNYDLSALPLNNDAGAPILPVDYDRRISPEYTVKDLVLFPTTPLFAVGFPRGYRVGGILPTWKQETLASDLIAGTYEMLADGLWIPGMSGSPVYLVTQTFQFLDGGSINRNVAGAYFVGIQSAIQPALGLSLIIPGSKAREWFNILP